MSLTKTSPTIFLAAGLVACEAAAPSDAGLGVSESGSEPTGSAPATAFATTQITASPPLTAGGQPTVVATGPNPSVTTSPLTPAPADPRCIADSICEPGCNDVDCAPVNSGGTPALPMGTGGTPPPGGAGAPASGGMAGDAVNGGSSSGGAASGGAAAGGVPIVGGAGPVSPGGTPGAGGSTGGAFAGMPSTAGSGGQPSSGCPASALFCEDFEAGSSLPETFTLRLNGDGTVAVDESVSAHSGVRSVRVDATGYQTFFALTGAPIFPPPSGALYLRVYLRLSEAMPSGHNTYFEAGPTGETDAQYETRVGVQQAMLMINQPAGDRGFLANQNYYNDQIIGAHLEVATWGCVETYFNPPASEIQVWLDDVEVLDLHRTDWQQDTLGELRFGYEKYAGPNTQIWYDDIVVSGERVGCE